MSESDEISGRQNPNAFRVRTRSVVLVDSTTAWEMLWSSPARIPGRFCRTRRARSTNAARRERAAHAHHFSRITIASAFVVDHRTQLSVRRSAWERPEVTVATQASLAAWRSVRSAGFFHGASPAPVRSRAREAASTSGVPRLAPALVEGVGRPLHHVRTTDTQHRCRAARGDVGDPAGRPRSRP